MKTKIKVGDTVEILSCGSHPKHKFNGETGVVERVDDGGVLLKTPASCGCNIFLFNEVVRKQRNGEWGGGSVAIHIKGFSVDRFWHSKTTLKNSLKFYLENIDQLWAVLLILEEQEKLNKKGKKE